MNAASSAYSFDYSDLNALAAYEIGQLDPAYRATSVGILRNDLQAYATSAAANPFGAAVDSFYWGSGEQLCGTALEALWYGDLTGDHTYDPLATRQRDYMLGDNPWGAR